MWAGGPINGTFFKWANKWYTYPIYNFNVRDYTFYLCISQVITFVTFPILHSELWLFLLRKKL
jgi:hypothetical protein